MVTSTSCSLHQQDEIPMVGEHMADKMRYDQQNGLDAKQVNSCGWMQTEQVHSQDTQEASLQQNSAGSSEQITCRDNNIQL